MAFKDDSVSAFLGQHANQSDWACVVLCRDCCLWQALQTVMYETIQASFYLKNSVSFLFIKVKGERRRAIWNLPVFSTVKDERVKSWHGSAGYYWRQTLTNILNNIICSVTFANAYSLKRQFRFFCCSWKYTEKCKSWSQIQTNGDSKTFFQKVEVKGLTLAHFSRVSINSQGMKRPPKR